MNEITGNEGQLFQWRSSQYILWALALIVIAWLIAYFIILHQEDLKLQENVAKAQRIAVFFEGHTLGTFHYGDSYLKTIRKEYTRNFDIEAVRNFMDDIPLNPSIASHVTIIDQNGTPLLVSGHEIKPGSNAADRDYFLHQKNSNVDSLYISLPHEGRNSGKLIIRLVRRFDKPNGEFAGVIFVALGAMEITNFFNAMKLGPKSSATLVGMDKKIRARSSYGRLGPGQDISGSRIWKELAISPTGSYRQTSVVDDITRIYAYRRLAEYPLIVAIGVSTEDASAAAWGNFQQAYIIALLATVLIIITALLLLRETTTSRNLRDAIERAEGEIKSRKTAEKRLLGRERELIRSNNELEKFAHIASHDLQEPLRKVQSFGDLLRSKYADVLDERGLDYLSRMCQAAKRMSILIDDLLKFSRLDISNRSYQLIDLNSVLEGVLSDLEVLIDETNCNITYKTLPSIEADISQMRQLFQNLIGNSIKYRHPDRDPEIEIKYKIRKLDAESEDYCEITISDNGIGFEAEYADRIFEIFQRLHNRNEYEGTGVGLAVVRKIVESNGGKVTATSRQDQGAIFTILLKMKQPPLRGDNND